LLEKDLNFFRKSRWVWKPIVAPTQNHYSGRHSFGNNSPAAPGREVFKPSTAGLLNYF